LHRHAEGTALIRHHRESQVQAPICLVAIAARSFWSLENYWALGHVRSTIGLLLFIPDANQFPRFPAQDLADITRAEQDVVPACSVIALVVRMSSK